jgi:hypothetical protein
VPQDSSNPRDLYLDGMESEVSSVVQHRAEPGYEEDVRLVSGWTSVLENPATYAPMNAVVGGVLKPAGVEDIADPSRRARRSMKERWTGATSPVPARTGTAGLDRRVVPVVVRGGTRPAAASSTCLA